MNAWRIAALSLLVLLILGFFLFRLHARQQAKHRRARAREKQQHIENEQLVRSLLAMDEAQYQNIKAQNADKSV